MSTNNYIPTHLEINNAVQSKAFIPAQFTALEANSETRISDVWGSFVAGESLDKYGKRGNKAMKLIGGLIAEAQINNPTAIAELNELRRITIQPRLLKEVQLLNIFGSYQNLGFNDTAYMQQVEYKGVEGNVQAEGTDVSFPFKRIKRTPLVPFTVSGGYAANYRQLQLGDTALENQGMDEVRKAIRNTASKAIIDKVVDAFANGSGVRYYSTSAGTSQAVMDDMIETVGRIGKVTVTGDRSMLRDFNSYAGFSATINGNVVTGVSEKVLAEIADNGILGQYNGALLNVIENPYNYGAPTVTDAGNVAAQGGVNYDTVLPKNLLFFIPTGGISPIQTFSIGGLTSMQGPSVSSGDILTRFDLSVAVGVADTSSIGIVKDTNR